MKKLIVIFALAMSVFLVACSEEVPDVQTGTEETNVMATVAAAEPEVLEVESIVAEPVELMVGQPKAIEFDVLPKGAVYEAVDFVIEDEGVAIIEDGELVAVAPGETVLTISIGDVKLDVTVLVDTDLEITLNQYEGMLYTGYGHTLTANVITVQPDEVIDDAPFPADTEAVADTSETEADTDLAEDEAENYTVLWKSSDESVVTVDENGQIKAIAPGKATITAYIEGMEDTVFADCEITVTNAPAPAQNSGRSNGNGTGGRTSGGGGNTGTGTGSGGGATGGNTGGGGYTPPADNGGGGYTPPADNGGGGGAPAPQPPADNGGGGGEHIADGGRTPIDPNPSNPGEDQGDLF